MKDQSYEDIINDIKENKHIKKANQLAIKARAFIEMYERSFGAPDKECKEFWDLKKELNKNYKNT